MTDFKAGDKAIHQSYGEVEVTYVPDNAHWIAFRRPDGPEYTATRAVFSPVPPADPRVDVVVKALRGETMPFWDALAEWERDLTGDREKARAVLAALDAMSPAEPTKVRDSDGDLWTRQRDGSYRCEVECNDRVSYADLDGSFGPLAPVE